MSTTPPLYELLEAAGRMGTAAVIDLAGAEWTAEAVRPAPGTPEAARQGPIPVTVPGCIHSDLVAAGIVDEADHADAEAAMQWIGRTDWRYRRQFCLTDSIEADRIELVCLSLDSLAEIRLDGQHVATAASAFVPHRLALGRTLAAGQHELELLFRGPVRWAEEESQRLAEPAEVPADGDAAAATPIAEADGATIPPAAAVRVPAHRFGTSWSPRTAGAGVTGPIRLVAWSIARIAALRPLVTRVTDDEAMLHVVVDLDRDGPASPAMLLLIRVCDPDGRLVEYGSAPISPDARTTRAVVAISNPRRWWPRGLGAPDRYRIDVCLVDADSQLPLDARTTRVGLRTVRLDTTEDAAGSRFSLLVNDVPVFCRGAGWAPVGSGACVESAAEIARRLDAAEDAGMNMLRVRGDGRYESDAFYRACDARGIMVWQDVMLSGGPVPDRDPLPRLIEAEVRHQVARLTTHPSVVLWCGGHGNLLGAASAGDSDEDPRNLWWHERLPQWIRDIDPTRPWWPNGPSGGPGTDAVAAHDPSIGDVHLTDVTVAGQRAAVARFVSSLAVPGPPTLETLHEVFGEVPTASDDPRLLHRRRDAAAHEVLAISAAASEAASGAASGPDAAAESSPSGDEWAIAAAEHQARVLAAAVDWHVRQRPACGGVLVDLLTDAWTCDGPGLLDGRGRPKLAYEAVARIFRAIVDDQPPVTAASVEGDLADGPDASPADDDETNA